MSKPETRNKIIKNTKKLFSLKGFEGVRTKEIAEASGISEVTLYKYFRSKEDLYEVISREELVKIDMEKLKSELSHDDIIHDMTMIADTLINNFYSNKDIYLMQSKEGKKFCTKKIYNIRKDKVFILLLELFKEYWDKGVLKAEYEISARVFIKNVGGHCRMGMEEKMSKNEVKKETTAFIEIFAFGAVAEQN